MELAASLGVGVLAVTDHDTVGGVPEALAAGDRLGVHVVPGVELSLRAPSGAMHLLGYFREAQPPSLRESFERMVRARATRAERIVALLAEAGAPVELADVRARAAGPIGRPHIADAVVAAGHARDRQDAFDRYLHDGGPAAVPHQGIGPEGAIAMVREAAGAPALAHPASLRMPPDRLDSFVARLARAGLAGIEVHRADHTAEQREAYARLARRHGLVPTGGSDFHRTDEPLRPGDTGDPPLPEDVLDRLLRA